ncbi:MAG TPA: hypothetical protein VG870_05435 [Chitinophagaceae bacterium]|nr:hypothetical protein [Chitinophagaceae bacterium]
MNPRIRKLAAILLILIGLVMIALGLRAHLLPPPLTGLGFLVIAGAFLAR